MIIKTNLNKVNPASRKNFFYKKISLSQTSSATGSVSEMDVLTDCYNYLSHINDAPSAIRINCRALTLAKEIISTIENEKVLFKKGFLPENFYTNIAIKLIELSDETDRELIIIHLKQTVIILKNAGVIISDKSKAAISGIPGSDEVLYNIMFNSFWNTTACNKIFPSNEESALELHRNRNIFKDLLLKSGRSSISKISNEFFDLTGFAKYNDMFHISFIDFYLITWLSHFGIIKQSSENPTSPILIEVTEKGSLILNSIS
jgi:hypothetical protein